MNTHSGQLERWLGAEQVEYFSRSMRGWYGPPIPLAGVPGNVYACGDGDFTGRIFGGMEGSIRCFVRDAWRRMGRPSHQLNTGFAALDEFLSSARNGRRETVHFFKSAPHTTSRWGSTWGAGASPVAGSAGAAAPGGTAHTSANTGAAYFMNAKSGERSFVAGGWINSPTTGSAFVPVSLLYDRLFSVAKTASSTATEAVTGVPTRYQSNSPEDPDYAGGNFVFPEGSGNLGAGVHNWTVCQYTDQDLNTGISLPSVPGVSSSIAGLLDMASQQWFMPLAAGDSGVMALTQMQNDASIVGALNFVIGHPLAWLPCLFTTYPFVFDGVRSAFNMARVFDDACLAMLSYDSSTNAPSCHALIEIVSG